MSSVAAVSLRQRGRDVHGDGGRADAALGADEGEDFAGAVLRDRCGDDALDRGLEVRTG